MILSHKFDSAVKRVYASLAGLSAATGVVALAGPTNHPWDVAIVVVASTVFVADVALGVAQQFGLLTDVAPIAATPGTKPAAGAEKAAREAAAVAEAVEAAESAKAAVVVAKPDAAPPAK